MSPMIHLQSSDGKRFDVELDAARQSVTLRIMIRDLRLDEGENSDAIPLPNVKSNILEKVLAWCRQHKEDEIPVGDDVATEQKRTGALQVPDWDREFLAVSQVDLCSIVAAANYLNIKLLLDYACEAVARSLKGKKPEEIRQTWGIKKDLTPAEEERIAKENSWPE